jgi:hypothetical protein
MMKTEHRIQDTNYRRQKTEDSPPKGRRICEIWKVFLIVVLAASSAVFAQSTVDFNDYFVDKTMRVDYYITGDSNEEIISIDQIYQTDGWAGNPKNLIFPFNNGDHFVKVYSAATNEFIYSKCFSTIFGEYKTTKPGRNKVKRTFHESALIPFPKMPVVFVVEARNRDNSLHPVFIEKIDPADANIVKDKPNKEDRIYESMKNGPAHEKLDMVFVAEGYTSDKWEKFQKDVDKYRDVFFSAEPYKDQKDKFNIYGVFRPSSENGVDEPRQGKFRNTVVSASYNALGLDRYLLVNDLKTLRDIAGNVPYDYLIVLANTSRYGGGGIYNNYTIFTADDSRSKEIFMHEFGHGFAGLADEYYDASVAYEEFYKPGIEPLEYNITALLDANNVKWKRLLSPGIAVPTPWGKDEAESLEKQRQENQKKSDEEVAALKKENADDEKIQEVKKSYREKNKQINSQISEIRDKYKKMYEGKIGVFEGAGYSSKGLYRSELELGMFYTKGFRYGIVSQDEIKKYIDFYTN